MPSPDPEWTGRPIFRYVALLCLAFVVLSAAAMLAYPGDATPGYSFLNDFFSDLGTTRTRGNLPNLVSMALFVAAVTGAGIGIPLFFFGFARFLEGSHLARLGRWFGLAAGLAFIGVAATPWNLFLEPHMAFMQWAFVAFLAASLLHSLAIWRDPRLPRGFVGAFAAFALALASYYALMRFGPSTHTPDGREIQVAGQKVIVYLMVVGVLLQARAAHRLQMAWRRVS